MSLAMERERALEFADRLHRLGPVTVTRFFGGAGLVREGVQFAFVLKGVLYLRVNDASRPDFEARGAAPFSYAGGTRQVRAPSYYELPDEILDDQDAFLGWMSRAWQVAATAQATSRSSPRKKPGPVSGQF